MVWFFSRTAEMVSPEDALKGRNHLVLENPRPHAVLGTPITGPWEDNQEVIYLGIGCFWGAEKIFWQTPGVLSTSVGFAGGVTANPTYREVCTGRTNHAEVVEVVYDPGRISCEELVRLAFESHDPTQGYRQGHDVGTQYRSVVYTLNHAQAQLAQEIADFYQPRLKEAGLGSITTEIMPLTDTPAGTYFRAEDEHQQYLFKNPHGYCPVHSTGVPCTPDSPTASSGKVS